MRQTTLSLNPKKAHFKTFKTSLTLPPKRSICSLMHTYTTKQIQTDHSCGCVTCLYSVGERNLDLPRITLVPVRTGEAQLDTSVHRLSTPDGLNTATHRCFQLLRKNRKETEKLLKEECFAHPQAWRKAGE